MKRIWLLKSLLAVLYVLGIITILPFFILSFTTVTVKFLFGILDTVVLFCMDSIGILFDYAIVPVEEKLYLMENPDVAADSN